MKKLQNSKISQITFNTNCPPDKQKKVEKEEQKQNQTLLFTS